ncbi:unnamed protein product [Parajaminaea phylloscopi]
MPLVLYDSPLSSYCQQVRIALREKGIPFEKITPSGLGTGKEQDPAWKSANVRIEVPTIVDGPHRIFDSTIINEYLEEQFPDTPRLLPTAPSDRARARLIEDICQTTYEAVHFGYAEVVWAKRGDGDLGERIKSEARREAAEIRSWLEAQLGSSDYFGGESFGWADVAVAPHIHRAFSFRDGMEPAEGSPLARWYHRISQRPSCQATFAEFDVAAAAAATHSSATFAAGTGNRRLWRDHRLEFLIRAGGLGLVDRGIEEGTIRFSWPNADGPGSRQDNH